MAVARARRRLERPPGVGAWVEDGERLAQVVGMAADGRYHLEDAHTLPDGSNETFFVDPDVLAAEWRPVRPEAA